MQKAPHYHHDPPDTYELIRQTAEAVSEGLLKRILAILADEGMDKAERNDMAINMRAKGYTFEAISKRLNISRTAAYHITKHIKQQSKHASNES